MHLSAMHRGACSPSATGTFDVELSDLILDDLLAVVAQRVPGFGGVYMDEDTRELFVWLTNPSQQAASAAQPHIVEIIGDPELAELTPVPLQAEYEFTQLKEWYEPVAGDIFALPGVVGGDIDDRRNRILFEVEDADTRGPAVYAALEAAGIPGEAVILEEAEDISVSSGLNHYHRPLVGGLQVQWFWDNGTLSQGCTLGVNAVRNGIRGIIMPSHCSSVRYQYDGGNYFQPNFDMAYPYHEIGSETVDSPGFTHAQESRCDRHKLCRWSDANFVQVFDWQAGDLGRIAKADSAQPPGWGGTTFRIVQEIVPIVGHNVVKIGRITGRTSGEVTNGCKDREVGDTPSDMTENVYMVLCSGKASYSSFGGDSGSPVFDLKPGASDDVYLVGLHWGAGPSSAYFSTINNVEKQGELGTSVKTCAPGFHC